jgi:hypothetical protein
MRDAFLGELLSISVSGKFCTHPKKEFCNTIRGPAAALASYRRGAL